MSNRASQLYIGTAEKDPVKQNSAIRQLIETVASGEFGTGTFSATDNFGGSTGSAEIISVLGSSGSPDSTANPNVIFQKYGTGSSSGTDQSLYVSAYKTSSADNVRIQAIFAEAQDQAGWSSTSASNNFIEGIRTHGILHAGTTLGSAYGLVSSAGEGSAATHTYLIGVEAEVNNNSTDAGTTFNNSRYSASFVASANGSKKNDVAFIVNPWTSTSNKFVNGFYVPSGQTNTPVSDYAFRTDAASVWGLYISGATYGAIGIPNNIPIRAKNAANSSDLNALTVSTSNVLVLGTDTSGVNLTGSVNFVTGASDNLTINNISGYNEIRFKSGMAVTGGTTSDLQLYSDVPSGGQFLWRVNSAQVLAQDGSRLLVSGYAQTGTVTTANLPAAAAGNKGARYFVSDASAATFGSTFNGGGANNVPVYSDGTNWRVG